MEIEILIALLFALGLITVIGHAIWVLLAMIFRAVFSEPKPEPVILGDRSDAQPRHDTHCSGCGEVLRAGDSFCGVCGRAQSSIGPIADLAMTARQLDKLLNQGKLDAATHKLVMQVIEEERERLTVPIRHDVTETRRETKPQPVAPAPVETIRSRDVELASPQTPPAVVEQNVFVV
ncbi:MAG: hypothetical protein ACREA2_12055, partial [Blastocatellia bacterium]